MKRCTVQEKIFIESKYIDKALLKDHLKNTIVEMMTGKCDQEFGYVISVESDIKIVDNIISSANSGIIFTVEFDILTIKPEKGMIFEGIISKIFLSGIFVTVEKMNILVPESKMNGYKFNASKNIFKKDSSVLNCGDNVKVVIQDVRYQKQNFDCIASLKM